MFQVVAFVAGTMLNVIVSWRSLRHWRSHGFYRFFAFEAILALVVLNAPGWFADPFRPLQLVSWLLLASCTVLAIHGFQLLVQVGKPEGMVENTTRLVRVGAYRYVRHPLYGALLLLAWGAFLKEITLATLLLLMASMTSLVFTARAEEAENRRRFGRAYDQYIRETHMFIPFFF